MPPSELSIVSAEGTWVVRAGGAVIGESDRALSGSSRTTGRRSIYFPRDDLALPFIEGSVAHGGEPRRSATRASSAS